MTKWVALMCVVVALGCGSPSPEPLDAGADDAGISAADAETMPDGQVAPPTDASTGQEPCDEPGAMRTVSCGNCGLAAQLCGADGYWEEPGECLSEGECAPATVERDTSMCGELARICDDSCNWRAWETITEPGECEPGAIDTTADGCPTDQVRDRTCTDTCQWDAGSDCRFVCSAPPAASRTGADPVCVPAGAFVLGSLEETTSRPVRTIILSEFHVDRFPVSKARYRMCLDAGACPTPAQMDFFDLGGDDQHVAGIDVPGAEAFCAWDGGQLITEYQWEKAARGPSPDARRNSWGDADGGCRHHNWTSCNEFPMTLSGYPDAISPYGVRMLGTFPEMTGTRYRADHFWLSNGDMDPGQPGSASVYPNYTQRVTLWWIGGSTPEVPQPSATTRRAFVNPTAMFRCVY